MIENEEDAFNFILELIRSSGWDLRFNQKRRPYAYIQEGFGNNEPGIKLLFYPEGGAIKVYGAIHNSQKVGVRRPFIRISLYQGVAEAERLIRELLLPRYQAAWQETQTKLAQLHKGHPGDKKGSLE